MINNCRLEITGFQKLGLQQREKINRLEKQIDHIDRVEYGLDQESDTESEHGSDSEKQSLEIGGESSQLVDNEESKDDAEEAEEEDAEKVDAEKVDAGKGEDTEKPKKGWFW